MSISGFVMSFLAWKLGSVAMASCKFSAVMNFSFFFPWIAFAKVVHVGTFIFPGHKRPEDEISQEPPSSHDCGDYESQADRSGLDVELLGQSGADSQDHLPVPRTRPPSDWFFFKPAAAEPALDGFLFYDFRTIRAFFLVVI